MADELEELLRAVDRGDMTREDAQARARRIQESRRHLDKHLYRDPAEIVVGRLSRERKQK